MQLHDKPVSCKRIFFKNIACFMSHLGFTCTCSCWILDQDYWVQATAPGIATRGAVVWLAPNLSFLNSLTSDPEVTEVKKSAIVEPFSICRQHGTDCGNHCLRSELTGQEFTHCRRHEEKNIPYGGRMLAATINTFTSNVTNNITINHVEFISPDYEEIKWKANV